MERTGAAFINAPHAKKSASAHRDASGDKGAAMTDKQLEAVARAIHDQTWSVLLDEHKSGHFNATRDYWEKLAKAALAALEGELRDAGRMLFWFREGVDGIAGLERDKYEYVDDVALKNGREEPTDDDCLEGFRQFTDDAIKAIGEIDAAMAGDES